jgi:hypothetical protein
LAGIAALVDRGLERFAAAVKTLRAASAADALSFPAIRRMLQCGERRT